MEKFLKVFRHRSIVKGWLENIILYLIWFWQIFNNFSLIFRKSWQVALVEGNLKDSSTSLFDIEMSAENIDFPLLVPLLASFTG